MSAWTNRYYFSTIYILFVADSSRIASFLRSLCHRNWFHLPVTSILGKIFKNFFRFFFYWIDFFCFQFVAWLSLDQKRIQDQRDGLLPCCLVHKTPQENEDQTNSSTDSKIPWSKKLLKKAARLIRSKVFKVSWCKIFFWEVSGIYISIVNESKQQHALQTVL